MKKTLNDTKNSTDGYISEFSLIQSLLHYSTSVGNCVLEPGEDLNIKESNLNLAKLIFSLR